MPNWQSFLWQSVTSVLFAFVLLISLTNLIIMKKNLLAIMLIAFSLAMFANHVSQNTTNKMAKKIDKEYCLTDNSVNVYGYRLLTEGFQQDRFNPAIGFLMHNRDAGVAVKWEDFRVDGDKLYAKPIVNDTLFPQLAEQIEQGFYNAASVGRIVALELSDDKSLKLPGQTGPTITKWFPRETSIVDIPGNYNALAKLYDESDHVLKDLSANFNFNNNMNEKAITVKDLSLLNLSDNATGEQISQAISDLVAKAAKVETLEKSLTDLNAKHNAENIDAVLQKGMSDRKLTKELAESLRKDYANNPDGLKDLVSRMPAQSLVTKTGKTVPDGLPEKFKGKSYQDLYLSGDLAELKANYPDYFETIKKA